MVASNVRLSFAGVHTRVPNNAADVEHSLLDDLSAEDRRKISVCLIDVAKHRG